MNQYTIYCTEEQTRKALELGAPIENIQHYASINKYYVSGNCMYDNGKCYFFPTAEEMIGWLGKQGIFIEINIHTPDRILADWKKQYIRPMRSL